MWNFRYMFLLVSCLFVCIVLVIAFYINRLCTINCLEYFNSLVLLKLILKNSIYIHQVRIKIKSKTKFLAVETQKVIKLETLEYFILVYSKIVAMYFRDHYTSRWLISTLAKIVVYGKKIKRWNSHIGGEGLPVKGGVQTFCTLACFKIFYQKMNKPNIHNKLAQLFSSTSFYFKNKLVKDSHKGKKCFLIFGYFFSKCTFLRFWHFFLA